MSGQPIGEVIVTGSRIRRDVYSSSSAISTFDADDLAVSGTVSPDEFLMRVPAFTGFQQTTSTNNGSDGQKKIDLRGLGFNRSLVLINGRRQIGDVNGDGAVDLNTVPEALIERVEVLKDGASTVYGADAIAGVINFILRKDFEGMEFSARYGEADEGGTAAHNTFSLVAGTNSERGNFVGAITYSEQKEMLQADREWALYDLFPGLDASGNIVPVRSGSSNSRRIRSIPGLAGNYIVDAGTGQARAFTAADTYNYSPVNALITPNEHWQASALGNMEVSESVNGYFELLYTRRDSHQRLAPDASFRATVIETPNNGVQLNDYVPASNPFNPFGVNPRNPFGVSNQPVSINRRFVESGGRIFVQGADTFRLVGGFEGEIGGSGISWDISYTYAQNEVINDTLNYGRFDRWATAVDPAACAADAACTAAGGVLNPFDDYGSISPGQMAYLSTSSLKDRYYGELSMISAGLDGDFGSLPGGPVGWAFGLEQRREKGEFSPDEFLQEGLTTSGASDPQSGSFTVEEVYGELLLPVLANLDISLSARNSDYDTSAGSKATYKVGVDFAPVDSVRLRATYGTGFRAPNITELNQGDLGTFPVVDPICDFGDRRLAAGDITQTAYDNCLAMGVDTSDAGAIPFAWQSLQTTRAPAVPLQPEESETFTAGVVFVPTFADGLSMSLDYWNIQVDELIGAPNINNLNTACMNSANFTDISCGAFDTDFDGNPDGVGVGQPYSGGLPSDAVTDFGNLGSLETAGIDVSVDYRMDVSWGMISGLNLGWSGTYLDTYKVNFGLGGEQELAGTADGFAVLPELRWNAEIGVSGQDWSVAWRTYFIGESDDLRRPPSATDDAKAESIYTHDIVGNFKWNNMTFYAGINNVTDEVPPFFHSAFNTESEPGMYDVIGRRFFLGTTVTF